MRKATQSSRAAPPIPGEGCLPGICPEGRGAASCHPQSWDGSGDPSSHLCFDLRQPVDTSGPRGRGHWADGGQAPDLPKSYRDTEPRGCFLTPFCSTRPMPRFPAWEFPKSPHPPPRPPVESSQGTGAHHPNSLPGTSGGERQALGRLQLRSWGSSAPACTPQPSPRLQVMLRGQRAPALPLLAVSPPGARPGHSPWHTLGPRERACPSLPDREPHPALHRPTGPAWRERAAAGQGFPEARAAPPPGPAQGKVGDWGDR